LANHLRSATKKSRYADGAELLAGDVHEPENAIDQQK